MTVTPSAGAPHGDAADEAFVARVANDLFRRGPELGTSAADRAEEFDALPSYGADAASAVAAHPTDFLLHSAPLGAAVPVEAGQPLRLTNAHRAPDRGSVVDVPYVSGPMVSEPPGLGALGRSGSARLDAGTPPGVSAVPVPGAGAPAGDGSRLYFLSGSRPGGGRGREARMPFTGYDAELVRRDFPALHQRVHGKRLVWLDNAATTQKPQCVLDEMARFYQHDNSNIHRGAHELAVRATDAYEGARGRVAALLGAASTHEVVFVRGTTEAINLVAQSYGRSVVGPGDEIVLTTLEHHSNIVPWQLLAKEKGASLRPVRIDDRGDVVLEHYASLLGPRTRIVALSQVSNALGTIVPVSAMAAMAKAVGATVVVDGAQGVPHLPVDLQSLGADFYAFSGHKLYGPTGVGALWGREALLEAMPPWQGGGQMIKRVDFESSSWNDLPYKFEAGTGTIGDAVGLGRAIDYVTALGLPQIAAHEQELLAYGTAALAAIPGLRLIGTSPHKAGVLSFVLEGTRVEEVGRFLDDEGIAVRAGHHCAQPALRHFGLEATVRPSIGLYNTRDDIDVLAEAVRKAANALRRQARR